MNLEYSDVIQSRISSSETNLYAKALYEEYKEEIMVADSSYTGTAHYNPYTKEIKLNQEADLNNCTGSGSTYFHEVGHMLDDYAGNGHSWLSFDRTFRQALECDVNKYVGSIMNNYGCSKPEAYDIISDQLIGDELSGVSDIFGSLTECKCQGDWGHSVAYWTRDNHNIEKEAFANMFEASMGDANKISHMLRFFPTAYSTFENIIKYR